MISFTKFFWHRILTPTIYLGLTLRRKRNDSMISTRPHRRKAVRSRVLSLNPWVMGGLKRRFQYPSPVMVFHIHQTPPHLFSMSRAWCTVNLWKLSRLLFKNLQPRNFTSLRLKNTGNPPRIRLPNEYILNSTTLTHTLKNMRKSELNPDPIASWRQLLPQSCFGQTRRT